MAGTQLSDHTLVAWGRVLLVGGDAALREALPLHLTEFQVVAPEGAMADTLSSARAAAPDLVLVAVPLDADARLLVCEVADALAAPLVALAPSQAEAAALALLEDDFADVVIADGGLPSDLGARLFAVLVNEEGGASCAARAPRLLSAWRQHESAGKSRAPEAEGRHGELEQRLAASLRSLENAHRQLRERATGLERVVAAVQELRLALTREDVADRVLAAMASLPGMSLVAVGLGDDASGALEITGTARLPDGVTMPRGRRTVMLDILSMAASVRPVSQSQILDGCQLRVHGPSADRTMAAGRGEWDLADLLDGQPMAVTPLRGSGASHGFLFAKAFSPSTAFDADGLRAIEILAHVAASSIDHLRQQEAERRRQEFKASVNRLSRALMGAHETEDVLAIARRALHDALRDATVVATVVRAPQAVAGALSGPVRACAEVGDEPWALAVAPVRAQLAIPVRCDGGLAAMITATSPHARAFDDMDGGSLDLFAEVVGKALAQARRSEDERRTLLHLRLVADIGRIASSSLDMDDVLSHALAHLCQQGPYEHAGVALVDRERNKLVLAAQASRDGVRLLTGLSVRLGEGITGAVAETGLPVLVPDVAKDPRYVSAIVGIRSELCVPLRVADETVGVLNVESTQLRAFDDENLVALAAVGDHLGHALANSRLFRQVRDRNRMLRESDRRKTEFLSIVAHDLRTPLTSIRSAAEVVLMYGDESADVKEEFLRSIRDETERLGRLVDDFLTHARMEEGVLDYDVVEFDLAEVLRHFVRVFEGPALHNQQKLSCHVPDDLPPVLADRERVAQVVANLLSNATRYLPPEGTVAVHARSLPGPEGAMIGSVQVDIVDDGPGILECHRERIFEKFVRLDEAKGGGTGLGLPIARAIIEQLGGRLWLAEPDGGGCRFSFTLPARMGIRM